MERSIDEGRACWWSSAGYGELSVDAAAGAFNETSYRFGGGVEYSLSETLSATLGGEREWSDNDGFARSDIARTNVGLGLNLEDRRWRLSVAVAGSFGDADVSRAVSTPTFADTLSADVDSFTLVFTAAAARRIHFGGWILELSAAVKSADAHVRRFEESSSTAGGWRAIVSGDEPELRFEPAILLAKEFSAGAVAIRPWLRIGGVGRTDDDHVLHNRFAGSPAATPNFATKLEIDDFSTDVGAGVRLAGGGAWSLGVGYAGEIGATVQEHPGNLDFNLRF